MREPELPGPRPEASLSVMVAICLLSGLAGEVFQLAPILYGALAQSRGYGAAELGRIAAVGGAGGLLTALSSPLWLPQAPLRGVALGLVFTAVVALLLLLFGPRTVLGAMSAMALFGVATGALYTLMFGAVSLYAGPEKILGWKLGTESVPGLVMLFGVSNFVAPHGLPAIIVTILISVVLLGVSAFLLPSAKPRQAAPAVAPGPLLGSPALWLAVAATIVQWAGVNALWPFMERIGSARGLTVATIGTVLTVGWLVASFGGVAAGALGDRFGTLKPFLMGTALSLGALLLFLDPTAPSFAIAANLFLTATIFAVVYAIAMITRLNTHPLFAGLGSAALQAGAALGPAMGGYVFQDRGPAGVFAFSGICFLASVGLYIGALAAAPRGVVAEPPRRMSA